LFAKRKGGEKKKEAADGSCVIGGKGEKLWEKGENIAKGRDVQKG